MNSAGMRMRLSLEIISTPGGLGSVSQEGRTSRFQRFKVSTFQGFKVSKFQSYFETKQLRPVLEQQNSRRGAFLFRSYRLEGGVEMQDVADLEVDAVVHHEIAAHDDVHIVRWRRGQHGFQLAGTGPRLRS